MAWDQGNFDNALKQKYAIQQQNANTAQQDVAQKPDIIGMQEQGANYRSGLASNTQLATTAMNNQNAQTIAGMQGDTSRDVAGLQSMTQQNVANTQAASHLGAAGLYAGARRYQSDAHFGTPGAAQATTSASPTGQVANFPLGYQYGYDPAAPGYRKGGMVQKGKKINVGEDGPEVLVPKDGTPAAVVGAQGPETIAPAQDSQVIPNPKLMAIMRTRMAGMRR